MPDVFITMKEAAEFEGVKYGTFAQRIARNPKQYKTKTQPQEGGGKEQVLIAVSSLSPKGRKAWRAAQKVDGRDVVIEKRTESAPWYVGVDLNHYTEQNKKAFYEAVELAARVQDFIDYDGPDRTAYAERYALGLGVSLPTLYRYVENVLKASAWALKMEKEDGQNRDYFRALALCRKPREKASFPSLTDEQKALIQNIWFDRRFAANLGTIEMLYEKFEEVGQGRGWESYPSIKTVARYIKHLMDSRGGESARYLAANGSREWKNKKMLKGKRDATSLKVMEYVVGDEHTFDFWVQWVAPNGKVKAVRPKLVAWMDMRSRAIVGDVACVFLHERLHLDTNKKTKVFYMRQGVNAYGFKIKATHMMLRTESKRREKRRVKAMVRKMKEGKLTRSAVVQAVNSWLGFARWACAYNLAKKIFAPYRFIKTEGAIPYGAISRNRQARRLLQQRRDLEAPYKAVA